MGSLTSSPDIPQVQQQPVIIQVPTPVPVATTTNTTASTESTSSAADTNTASSSTSIDDSASAIGADTANDADGDQSEAVRLAREDSLLSRSRGRTGTILTGFTGLLSDTVGSAGRKSLLGE